MLLHDGFFFYRRPTDLRFYEIISPRGFRNQRKAYPITKRVKSTVTGVKSRKSTLVETKVVPQMIMVMRAAAWPRVRCRELIKLTMWGRKAFPESVPGFPPVPYSCSRRHGERRRERAGIRTREPFFLLRQA